MQQLLRLIRPVTIKGDPIFGRYEASVTLGPAQEYAPLSWVLQTPKQRIVIDTNTTEVCNTQNLAVRLDDKSTIAHTIEHLLPLKTAGLLGATITCSH
jgi:UDP-3-O-acyl-N-acetylglucosamine deacetylase